MQTMGPFGVVGLFLQVDWAAYRNEVAQEDLYTPHTFALDAFFSIVNVYEKFAPSFLRKWALDWIYEVRTLCACLLACVCVCVLMCVCVCVRARLSLSFCLSSCFDLSLSFCLSLSVSPSVISCCSTVVVCVAVRFCNLKTSLPTTSALAPSTR